jgi:osomolarity two-component system, response regulator SKN7
MLEKHLSHLKKQPPGMEAMGAPPPPGALTSAKRSMKSEDSPVTSPATASNWNSPGGLAGVSPSGSGQADDPYIQAVQNSAATGPYGVQQVPQPGLAPAQLYQTSPGGPIGGIPRQQIGPPAPAQHRRGISDITGGVIDMGDAKRQQLYAPVPPMGQPMTAPMPQHPMQQRPPGR